MTRSRVWAIRRGDTARTVVSMISDQVESCSAVAASATSLPWQTEGRDPIANMGVVDAVYAAAGVAGR